LETSVYIVEFRNKNTRKRRGAKGYTIHPSIARRFLSEVISIIHSDFQGNERERDEAQSAGFHRKQRAE
jgi:hypothetical protein